MRKYLTPYVFRYAGKVYPPNSIVDGVDDAIAEPLIKQGLLVPVLDSLNDPMVKGSPPVDENGNTISSDAEEEQLAQALSDYNEALSAVEEKRKALAEATPQQKGVRTSQLNKAEAVLAAAEEKLNAAREKVS